MASAILRTTFIIAVFATVAYAPPSLALVAPHFPTDFEQQRGGTSKPQAHPSPNTPYATPIPPPNGIPQQPPNQHDSGKQKDTGWLLPILNSLWNLRPLDGWQALFNALLVSVGFLQWRVYRNQADTMRLQAQIAAKVIDLEQPYLLVKEVAGVTFPEADSPLLGHTFHEMCADIEVVNYGRTPAVLHIVHATILPLDFTPRRVNLELFPVRPITDIVGTQRTDVVVVAIKGIKVQSMIVEQIMSGNAHVFVYGTLAYSNGSGSVIETCFAFDWQGGDSKCVRSTKPEHNYRKTYEGEEAQAKIAGTAEPPLSGPSFTPL